MALHWGERAIRTKPDMKPAEFVAVHGGRDFHRRARRSNPNKAIHLDKGRVVGYTRLMEHPVDQTRSAVGFGQANANPMNAVFAEAYQELRKLARLRLRAGGRNTVLDTTSLVHESYLRLATAGRFRAEDRIHFLRYAGCAMRSVVVDAIRRRQSGRRGGAENRITLTTSAGFDVNAGERQILQVHEALTELAKYDTRMAQVVEMRYFGGLTETEIAEALEVTERTVRRDWEKARLWLSEALK